MLTRGGKMLTIADEGGIVREKFDKMGFKVQKMCVKETKYANLATKHASLP